MAVRLEHIYSQGHGHGHGQDGQNSQQKKKIFVHALPMQVQD